MDKISSVFDILGDESGAITIPLWAIKKIKDLIKRKKFTKEAVIAGLKRRGATTKDIEKFFPPISIREMNEGESEWLKNGYTIVMKNIIYNVIVSLLSGIGIFFIVAGVNYQSRGPYYKSEGPIMIGIGTAIIVGAVLLYKNAKSKSK